mgnify:FL=1
MNAGTGKSETKQQKLSYEQLNNACNQLWQQNKQLAARNRELETFAMNKRLDYLFKVLELSNQFSSDFVGNCSSEIEQAMTIPQDIEEDKKEE